MHNQKIIGVFIIRQRIKSKFGIVPIMSYTTKLYSGYNIVIYYNIYIYIYYDNVF